MPTTMENVLAVLVLIAIITSAGSLWYGLTVAGDVSTLADSMADLADEMGDLTTSLGTVTTSVGAVTTSVADIGTSVADLATGVADVATSVASLATATAEDLATITADITGVTADITGLTADITGVTGDLADITGDLATITGNLTDIADRVKDVERIVGPTLTVIGPWSGAEMDAFLPVLEAFEDKTGTKVSYRIFRAEDLAPILPAQFAAGQAPGDVIFMWNWFIQEKGEEGHILEVTGKIDEADFRPGVLDFVKVDDKLYGGAYTGKGKPGFWYRKSFFTANGLTVPTTWAEFLTLLDDIAAIPSIVNPILSGDGVGWPLSDITEHFIATYGGPQLHRDLTNGTVAWNSTQVKTIFTDRIVPLLAGNFSDPRTWDTYIENWWNGSEYGLYFMGSWITGMAHDPTDLGVFSLPGAAGAEGVVFTTDYFFVPAYTEHPKEALELLEFLASEEGQSLQVAEGGHIATNINVPLDAYPPGPDTDMAVAMDLDDTIGGEFQTTFWSQLKLLWVSPGQLDAVLDAIEAKAP
jgi:multiple sugar transport system substrate-binding protein